MKRILFIITLLISLIYVWGDDYQCSNPNLSEEDRKFIVKEHNDKRRNLANGKAYLNGVLLTSARNMHKLDYSCSVENETQKIVNTACQKGNFKTVKDINTYRKTVSGGFNRTNFLTEALKYWFDEDYDAFINMMWHSKKWIGCGLSKNCGDNKDMVYFACKYTPKETDPRSELYRPGEPCLECKDKCDDGLCIE